MPVHERLGLKVPGSQVLSHLNHLEAESIHILREVPSELRNPVMLSRETSRSCQHAAAEMAAAPDETP